MISKDSIEPVERQIKKYLNAPPTTGIAEFDSVVEYLSREIVAKTIALVDKPEDFVIPAQNEIRGLLLSMEIVKDRVKGRNLED